MCVAVSRVTSQSQVLTTKSDSVTTFALLALAYTDSSTGSTGNVCWASTYRMYHSNTPCPRRIPKSGVENRMGPGGLPGVGVSGG